MSSYLITTAPGHYMTYLIDEIYGRRNPACRPPENYLGKIGPGTGKCGLSYHDSHGVIDSFLFIFKFNFYPGWHPFG